VTAAVKRLVYLTLCITAKMRPLQLLLSLSSCLILIIVLSFIAASKSSTLSSARRLEHDNGLGAYFSWNSPSSLFPPSAVISLTDDNSTFFLARPAAFGPPLPARGLSGQIWIGAGFGDNNPAYGAITGAEGELGCSDVPGWADGEYSPAKLDAVASQETKNKASETSPHANGSKNKRDTESDHQPLPPLSEDASTSLKHSLKPSHADIQSLQESAEIAGKVVLLSRGGCGFLEKVKWVQRRGGVALIVGDDMRGGPLVTMYARGDTSNVTIPSIFTSHTTAHLLSKLVPSGGFIEDVSAQDAARTGTDLPTSGKSITKNKKQPDSSDSRPAHSLIVDPQSQLDQEASGSWFGSFFSSPDKERHDSRRPPSSGKIDWVLQQNFEDEVPKKHRTKAATTVKSTKQTKAPSSDDFVIGVHDWRDPDLLEPQVDTAQAASSRLPKSIDHSSAAPQAGPKGGSITPGSGEYHHVSEEATKPKSLKKAEKGHSDPSKETAKDKAKSWFGLLTGSDHDKDYEISSQVNSKSAMKGSSKHEDPSEAHDGLWVTLTPASMSSSPFFDTLLVLVVSPLVTLTIVYALLLLRSRIRRRRWRAPKSVVDRLPVRTYHTIASSNSSNASESAITSPLTPTPATPLLHSGARAISQSQPRPRLSTVSEVHASGSSSTNAQSLDQVQEKREAGLAEWRRRYGGRQRECIICIDEYVDGVSRVMSLPCGHEFHADCM
jgi:hypothetical protein